MSVRKNDFIWRAFSRFVSWGMRTIPRTTVWSAEKAFYLSPRTLRSWVVRYTSERILACVVGGDLSFVSDGLHGDAIMFYPLAHCVRYALQEHPELKPMPLFAGHILTFIVPPGKQLKQYHLYGYAEDGTRYDGGILKSHSDNEMTRVSKDYIEISKRGIQWRVQSKRYLTSFVMLHSNGKPHAAGYSRRTSWRYPDTKYLPHVVIPPDGTTLHQRQVSVMILIVNKDAWVPEILIR